MEAEGVAAIVPAGAPAPPTAPGPVPYLPVSYLAANAALRPQAPAVIDPDRELTFAALHAEVLATAAGLAAAGLSSGDRVGVHLPNCWEYVVLELAIPLAGGVVLPLPPSLAAHELTWALGAAGAARLIVPAGMPLPAELPPGCTALAAPTVCRPGPVPPGAPVGPAADPDRVVEIAMTSGTTGLPKLASLTARLKQATFEGFVARLGIGPGDRVLVISPVTHGLGGMCLFGLRVGAALLLERRARFDPAHTLRWAERAQATHLVGVPTNVIRLLESPALAEVDLRGARVTAVAGSLMPPQVARAWEARTGSAVCSFYGSMDAGQLAVGSPADPPEKRWHTVGRPHDVCEMKIAAPDGRPLPAGEIGEVCMRGPTVQPRYWGETTGPLAPDGFAHMGDLGFLDPEGYLHLVGRVMDTIIRGGANINPSEVEAFLHRHPAVAEACVVGRPDPQLGERTVAFVVLRPDARLELAELRGWLEDAGLARYKWPEAVRSLAALPLKGPGKVDRARLRQLAAAGDPSGTHGGDDDADRC